VEAIKIASLKLLHSEPAPVFTWMLLLNLVWDLYLHAPSAIMSNRQHVSGQPHVLAKQLGLKALSRTQPYISLQTLTPLSDTSSFLILATLFEQFSSEGQGYIFV